MSLWISRRDKDGRRMLYTASFPVQLAVLAVALVVLVVAMLVFAVIEAFA